MQPSAQQRRGIRGGLRVLVTGGAGGIGLAIAKAFHDEHARVHICDLPDVLDGKRRSLPVGMGSTAADVASSADVDRLFDAVSGELGGLDVLVNNAAITGPTGPIESNDPGHWLQTIQVNLVGAFHCTRKAVPLLRNAGGGSIVMISSIAGRLGYPERTAYAASKWALIGLTQSVAMEAGPSNIRVNAVLPGIVTGERQARVHAARARALGIADDEMHRRVVTNVSLRRKIEQQEVADAVLFLCSDAASAISGTSLGVCGNVETMRRG